PPPPPHPRPPASPPSLSRCPCTRCQADPRHWPTVPRRPRPLLPPADFFNSIGREQTVRFKRCHRQSGPSARMVTTLCRIGYDATAGGGFEKHQIWMVRRTWLLVAP